MVKKTKKRKIKYAVFASPPKALKGAASGEGDGRLRVSIWYPTKKRAEKKASKMKGKYNNPRVRKVKVYNPNI